MMNVDASFVAEAGEGASGLILRNQVKHTGIAMLLML
jgi:hypothetical protein